MPFWEVIMRVLSTIAALALVLFLAWALLRWMNRRVPGMGGGASRMIKVLDRVQTGKSGVLMLVKVQDKVFLVAVNDHAVETIHTFDDPDGAMDPPEAKAQPTFTAALRDAASKAGFGKKNNDEGDAP